MSSEEETKASSPPIYLRISDLINQALMNPRPSADITHDLLGCLAHGIVALAQVVDHQGNMIQLFMKQQTEVMKLELRAIADDMRKASGAIDYISDHLNEVGQPT